VPAVLAVATAVAAAVAVANLDANLAVISAVGATSTGTVVAVGFNSAIVTVADSAVS
jgi:hypothetical protein